MLGGPSCSLPHRGGRVKARQGRKQMPNHDKSSPHAGPEQRKTPRYELSAYIDCAGSEVYLHHKLLNISLGGICFQCDSPEPVGTEVELLVHFPEISAQLPCRAQVVWANRSAPS